MSDERAARLLHLSFPFCLVGRHLLCMQPQEQGKELGSAAGVDVGEPLQATARSKPLGLSALL